MQEYTSRQRAGFVVGAAVALVNIPGAFIPIDPDAPGPPIGVLVAGVVFGVLTAGLLLLGWRSGKRWPVRAAVVLLLLNALTALPAFFVEGVPAWVRMFAGLFVLATVAAVVLLFSPAERTADARPARV
jgi:peptidoglycan/LPS O-acetylase OafA/YrhL